ncbi:MAG: hypothetical protein AB1758_35305 [Candidatus Eremiobacterota bacterium]
MSEQEAPRRSKRRPRRSAEIKNLDGQIAERFRMLRRGLYVGPTSSAQERKDAQREMLGKEMGVSAAVIEAFERREQPIGAAELLHLMTRYSVDPTYFVGPNGDLPLPFVWEQRFKELNEKMDVVIRTGGRRRSVDGESRRSKRKGGWLKGLPRKAKTPKDAAIIEAWKEARAKGIPITSIKSLMEWKKGEG